MSLETGFPGIGFSALFQIAQVLASMARIRNKETAWGDI